ncbi:DUF2953 domain-containing protein [Paenibacillus sp. MWE-103]|uniref:DUF2953 domain-containing protein n=1 Tax=Paenibacillus artemisiicola TaxID=1172618 RepID=A0ABS3W6W5_9BACL|nr:DUF2953 domain-containing protein [Paenibacillus artemisiicola]MBO7744044.1 DUF2953 domain-containing protein [Paenibacillus artemisiicola]
MLGYPFGWMIAAGLFFLLLLVIASSQVVISGHIKRVGENDDAELRIRALMGLVHYHWQLPEVKAKGIGLELKRELTAANIGGVDSNTDTSHVNPKSFMASISWTQAILRHTDDLLGWVRRTLNHVRITEWKWASAVGTGDAMWTAMATGTAWSVKTTAIGVLSQLIRLETDPELSVQPVYQGAHFSTEGQFTAKITFGYAFYAGIRLAVKMKKVAKGVPRGLVGWQRILLRG